jgi:hypothetical protein
MGEEVDANRICVERPKEEDELEYLYMSAEIILKWI